jgi:hypothetical protein
MTDPGTSPSVQDTLPPTDEINPQLFIWGLLVGGFLLACFAGPLGWLMAREYQGPGSYSWNPDRVQEMAWTIRSLGFMVFAAGLVERLCQRIASAIQGKM